MSDLRYNDNELLYLISQHNEAALELLLKKYTPLIKKRLSDYKIKSRNYDDFYQECLITFFNTIQRFREEKNGIFNLYLDYAIKNKIKTLLKKEQNYFYNVSLSEDLEYVCDNYQNDKGHNIEEPKTGILSDFEKRIYDKYYKEGYNINDISLELKCDVKKVYNALSRIRIKLSKSCGINNETVKKEKYITSSCIDGMSHLERMVYDLYMRGANIKEIAEELNCSLLKATNALSRAKRKRKL